jgi:hypothetical protein
MKGKLRLCLEKISVDLEEEKELRMQLEWCELYQKELWK